MTKLETQRISLDTLQSAYGKLKVTLKGTAPLIVHRFSEKARDMMRDAQTGKTKAVKKPPKDPQQQFLDAMHVLGERPQSDADLKTTRYGVPATAFKQAIVRMFKLNDVAPMTDARCMFHIRGSEEDYDLVELNVGQSPKMREDVVRLQGKTADLRWRPQFDEWGVTLEIDYNNRMIQHEQLLSLINDAGIANGLGEMRPAGRASSGTYGTWEVTEAEVSLPKDEENS